MAMFPLGGVLFPGALLPLHIFEDRYRRLVRELLDHEDGPRRFGVVAIEAGAEVGDEGLSQLYDIGCTAVLTRVEAYSDGRFDILAVGERRFKILTIDTKSDLVRAEVEFLPEAAAPGGSALRDRVVKAFGRYRSVLLAAQGAESAGDPLKDTLPEDPTETSYLIAAAMVIEKTEKQQLLAAGDVRERLGLELQIIRREVALLSGLATRPAVELARFPYHPN